MSRRSKLVKRKMRRGRRRWRKRTRRGLLPHPSLRGGQLELVLSSSKWAGCP